MTLNLAVPQCQGIIRKIITRIRPGSGIRIRFHCSISKAGEFGDTHTFAPVVNGEERGATFPDFGLRPVPSSELACLNSEEIGLDTFTVDGCLITIEANRSQ